MDMVNEYLTQIEVALSDVLTKCNAKLTAVGLDPAATLYGLPDAIEDAINYTPPAQNNE